MGRLCLLCRVLAGSTRGLGVSGRLQTPTVARGVAGFLFRPLTSPNPRFRTVCKDIRGRSRFDRTERSSVGAGKWSVTP